MKKILNILIIALVFLSSCTKEFLETEKIGEQTIETFYQTDEQANMAATACYSQLWHYRYVSSSFAIGNITTDDAVKGSEPGDMADITELEVFNIQPNNMLVGWKYPRVWEGILKCNFLITNLEGAEYPELSADIQKRVIAEAKFLRAYYYFDAVRTWGGVPIIKTPLQLDQMTQTRATAAEVYAFIEEDLKAAEADLPLKSEYAAENEGRASKGAAQAMLVKVCAYQASPGYQGKDFYNADKWTEAKQWAEKLIASGEYSLYQGDFGDIFEEEGENGSGSIFEIQFTETDSNGDTFNNNGNFTTVFTMPRGPWGWGLLQPTVDLYNEFESDDPRRDATLITSNEVVKIEQLYGYEKDEISDDQTGLHNLKNYLDPEERPTASFKNSPVNERVIRLSDVYLMYAEACYHTSDEATARQYVNYVRERARSGNASVLPDITASGNDLLEAIYHERRVELALENHRFFDLIRWGRLEKEVKTDGYLRAANITDNGDGTYTVTPKGTEPFKATNLDIKTHWVMPIPQSEIDITNGVISQNEGY